MERTVIAIAAMDEGRVIGARNQIPWHIEEDMRRFAELTRGHSVLMGRRTYESLPARYRPLPDRKNIVASRSAGRGAFPAEVELCADAAGCVKSFKAGQLALPTGQLWVIGGARIYQVTQPWWDEVQLTLVHGSREGDAFFPLFEQDFTLLSDEDRSGYRFLHYRRKQSDRRAR